jgi:hypothetical protein
MSTEATQPTQTTIKGHCPQCGPDRFADIVGEHVVKWEDDEAPFPIWGRLTYRILKCRGCDSAYFQHLEVHSEVYDSRFDHKTGQSYDVLAERTTYWPLPAKREQPEWAAWLSSNDQALSRLFDDVYVALNNDLRTLAAMGVRTAFDRGSELLGVDPSLTFEKKLNALEAASYISAPEKTVLAVLTDAGGAAAHRGWVPKPSELQDLVSLLESFIHRSIVAPATATALAESIPAKPKPAKPAPAATPSA